LLILQRAQAPMHFLRWVPSHELDTSSGMLLLSVKDKELCHVRQQALQSCEHELCFPIY
jgi:hypothetical protein